VLDINCTYDCRHQTYGKCTLNTGSNVSQDIDENFSMDCPYYEASQRKKDNPDVQYYSFSKK